MNNIDRHITKLQDNNFTQDGDITSLIKTQDKRCFKKTKCVELGFHFCLGTKLPYKYTSLILANDSSTQQEVQDKLRLWKGLQNVPKCWAVVQPLLCAVYMPKCENDVITLPSQEMCRISRGPCRIVEKEKGWPDFLSCDKREHFPSQCKNDIMGLRFNSTGRCEKPLVRTENPISWYEGVEGCGIQCENPLFTTEEHQDMHLFIKVVTFIIDWKNANKYPAVIIFYINSCFLIASLGWLAQFLPNAREKIVCRTDGTLRRSDPSAGENLSCAVVFICVYYFTMAGVIWFVMLSYSWYISFNSWGAFSRSSQSDGKTSYYHMIAWSVPLILTIIIMALGEVDGDSMSGICFVGYIKPLMRGIFVLLPIGFFITCGAYFLIRGIIKLIYLKVGSEKLISNKAQRKIGIAIVRLGLSAFLALAFYLTTFGCHVYEFTLQHEWMNSFRDFVICEANVSVVQNFARNTTEPLKCQIKSRPNLLVVQIHLISFFAAGVIMSSWVWTKASYDAWKRWLRKLLRRPINEPVKIRKHDMIARAFAKRRKLMQDGHYSMSMRSAHDDPVGMNFDLNTSAATQDMSTTFIQAIPKFIRRRGALMDLSQRSLRRHSLDSQLSLQMNDQVGIPHRSHRYRDKKHFMRHSRRGSDASQVSNIIMAPANYWMGGLVGAINHRRGSGGSVMSYNPSLNKGNSNTFYPVSKRRRRSLESNVSLASLHHRRGSGGSILYPAVTTNYEGMPNNFFSNQQLNGNPIFGNSQGSKSDGVNSNYNKTKAEKSNTKLNDVNMQHFKNHNASTNSAVNNSNTNHRTFTDNSDSSGFVTGENVSHLPGQIDDEETPVHRVRNNSKNSRCSNYEEGMCFMRPVKVRRHQNSGIMMLGQSHLRPQRSHCKHINRVGNYSPEDVAMKRGYGRCEAKECYSTIGNLWACLHENCLFVGCAGNEFQHILTHFQEDVDHCIILDLHSLRVFCYRCENEVFLENNDPPLPGALSSHPIKHIKARNVFLAEPESDSDDEEISTRPRGLTGLKNLGNTCYINAAIQALSNCPPLTQFFLDCGLPIRNSNREFISKSFQKLMHNIWHKRRPSFLTPDTLVSNFKESNSAHWIFGNYNQQDCQEFLRYFMDALHEELKEPVGDIPSRNIKNCYDDLDVTSDSNDDSSSELDYESCESGMLSEIYSSTEENAFSDSERSTHKTELASDKMLDHEKPTKSNNVSRNSSEIDIKNRQETIVKSKGLEHKDPDNRHQKSSAPASDHHKNKYNLPVQSSCSDVSMYALQTAYNTAAIHNLMKKEQTKRKPPEFHSTISDIFDGKLMSSVQCLTCDTISSTKETFQDVSLPIPTREQLVALHSQGQMISSSSDDPQQNQSWINWGWSWLRSWLWGPSVTLHDCLAAFFSADELKGDNMYSCGKCKKLRNGIKYSRVVNLPEVLCIHLKRFRNDLTKTAKINNLVSFPLEGLDLNPYMHKDSKDRNTKYDLNAVICHYGSDSGCGHYITYATNTLNGGWYEFDDQYVTEVMPAAVIGCEAYVLFYRKTSEDMNRRRDRVVELMKRSNREPGLLQFYISKQWVNKFNTFSDPGPITNTDFLCKHGGVHPIKANVVENLCTVLSQSVWEYLFETFGGGPACNHLFVCPTCQAERNYLERRQKHEFDIFVKLHKEFQAIDQPVVIYALSMSWFREWEHFVRSKDMIIQPPGPIDNSKVVYQKGNQQMLKPSSDYGQMSEAMWFFFYEVYGGGPQITIRPSSSPTSVVITNNPPPRVVHSPNPKIKECDMDDMREDSCTPDNF
ncbi:Ubiquitin carboxyl-terminal hydrolase 20 [Nymphon striatum]|nr:Ubiquitin carboxyl-terminal hydrolase 20 [Nymphon striatum]